MAVFSQYALLAATGAGVYLLYQAAVIAYEVWTSPVKDLPGPRNPSLLFGNMKEFWRLTGMGVHERWAKQYGSVFTYRLLGSRRRLCLLDVRAIHRILTHPDEYRKPDADTYIISQLFGRGLLAVEGQKHRQQRRVMNPAFGPVQIKSLTKVFLDKAIELRDVWAAASATSNEAERPIEVLSWLNRATLDIIGLAGFNHHFNSLSNGPQSDDLSKAFSDIFNTSSSFRIISAVRALFPFLRFLTVPQDREVAKSQKAMRDIGESILNDSRSVLLAEYPGNVEAARWQGKDLLSLLLKANMATDLRHQQRMSDEDVLCQLPTFLVAGHETTSAATAWALFAVTQSLDVQDKLRRELLAFPHDRPTMEELEGLPYLDKVVREVLRLYPPVVSLRRVASKDDIIPLEEKIKNTKGEWLDHIEIREGQEIVFPIAMVNRLPSLWGDDAEEFKPDRWLDVPTEQATRIPGVWGSMMTFSGGPRACIGFRFSIVEMKTLLFVLIRAFKFELAVPVERVSRKVGVAQRPVVKTGGEDGNELPLIITPVLH